MMFNECSDQICPKQSTNPTEHEDETGGHGTNISRKQANRNCSDDSSAHATALECNKCDNNCMKLRDEIQAH